MLTPEQRASIEEQLAAFNGAERNIMEAMRPLDTALDAVRCAKEAMLQAHGVDFHGYCECGKPLLTGDKIHSCDDGPTLCEECAPTWADIQAQLEGAPRLRFEVHLQAHIDAGGSITDKVVTVLEDF